MAFERSIKIDVDVRGAKSGLSSLNSQLGTTDKTAQRTTATISALKTALATVASAASIASVVRIADEYQSLQNKIRAVTDASTDLAKVNEDLLNVSLETRSSLTATTDLYSKLILVNDNLNLSQTELVDILSTVSKAVSTSGASAQAAEASIVQFAQALGGDFKASSQELNSILEQTPSLAKAIADGLGKSTSELKKLSAEGLLSSELVIQALQNSKDAVDVSFARTITTVSQSLTNLNTVFTAYIGKTDEANGATQTLAKTINNVAINFDDIADTTTSVLIPALTATAAVIGGRLTQSIVALTVARVADTSAAIKEVAAEKASAIESLNEAKANSLNTSQVLAQTKARVANFTAIRNQTGSYVGLNAAKTALARATQAEIGAQNALTAATVRYTAVARTSAVVSRGLGSALAFIGGPAGAAAIAVSAIAVYALTSDDAKKSTEELNSSVDTLSTSLENLSKKQAAVKLIELDDTIEQLEIANRAAKGLVETYENRAARGFTVDSEKLTIALGKEESASTNLSKALSTREKLESIINGTYEKATTNVESLVNLYSSYKSKLDQTFSINQKYDNLIVDINKNIKDQKERTELLSLAEQNRAKELDSLNVKLTKTQDTATKRALESIEAIKAEREATEEGEKALFIYRKTKSDIANIEKANLPDKAAQIALVKQEAEAIYDVNQQRKEQEELEKKNEKAAEESKKAYDDMYNSISDGITEAIVGFESLEDVATSVANSIYKAFVQQNLTDPLLQLAGLSAPSQPSTSSNVLGTVSSFVGDLFGGSSSSFDISGLDFFASGGVINSPTVVGTSSSGKTAIGGEAGPEAVLPLTRTSSGNLGVEASMVSSPVIVNVNNESGGESTVEETSGPNGERIINVTVLKAVKSAISSGTLDKDFKTSYGINRVGT
jgi:tape measure domain-containing protein